MDGAKVYGGDVQVAVEVLALQPGVDPVEVRVLDARVGICTVTSGSETGQRDVQIDARVPRQRSSQERDAGTGQQ